MKHTVSYLMLKPQMALHGSVFSFKPGRVGAMQVVYKKKDKKKPPLTQVCKDCMVQNVPVCGNLIQVTLLGIAAGMRSYSAWWQMDSCEVAQNSHS